MKYHPPRLLAHAGTFFTLALAHAIAATVTFEDVPLGSPNGPSGVWNGQAGTGGLNIGGANFNNSYTDYGGGFYSWDGFTYSNHTDTNTPGYGNQYSAYPGAGAGGSSQFALGYSGAIIHIGLADLSGKGAYLTNTTYSALSMLLGDDFAKKFGGVSGDDPDFFKLIISGYAGGSATGTPVEFYLADFRFTNNTQDYIVNKWTYVDFSSLGTVDEIRFGFESTDIGMFGINTPTYFALDNLTAVPELGSILLVLLSGLCLFNRRR